MHIRSTRSISTHSLQIWANTVWALLAWGAPTSLHHAGGRICLSGVDSGPVLKQRLELGTHQQYLCYVISRCSGGCAGRWQQARDLQLRAELSLHLRRCREQFAGSRNIDQLGKAEAVLRHNTDRTAEENGQIRGGIPMRLPWRLKQWKQARILWSN